MRRDVRCDVRCNVHSAWENRDKWGCVASVFFTAKPFFWRHTNGSGFPPSHLARLYIAVQHNQSPRQCISFVGVSRGFMASL